MKNVTLSADEALIEGVHAPRGIEHTTLNNLFREWLARYAGRRAYRPTKSARRPLP